MNGTRMDRPIVGRVYRPDGRVRDIYHAGYKKMIPIVEFDWREIKPNDEVWGSIRDKYNLHYNDEIGGAGMGGYITFTSDITPDEALQILRLTKAQKASITINSQGIICYWRLNKERLKK